MGSEFGGSIEFEYSGSSAAPERDKLVEMALADWRAFIDDPEAALPWNTSLKVLCHEGSFEATATIRWERVA
jgi:hypothetical protein